MARPISTSKYTIEEIVEAIDDYVDTCLRKKEVPILKEVFVKKYWNYGYITQTLKNRQLDAGDHRLELSINHCIDAKEYMLERLAEKGKIDKTVAIFSLKQLGWKDQQIIDIGENAQNNLKITLKVAE
jgi:inorganic pyrophosphatase